jgi:RimJ/RimL family protein N-acetyltransferase
MTVIPTLGPGDAATLDAFLRPYTDTSMFLRANARAAGLVDRGEPLQATYVGAFEGDVLCAVAAQCWNGMVLVQAPRRLAEVVRAAVGRCRRPVLGISGEWSQVLAARAALGLDAADERVVEHDDLFALDLGSLVVPSALAEGAVRCRRATEADLPLLGEWRAAYRVETLNSVDGPALRADAHAEVARLLAHRIGWVLVHGDAPVAYSAFNAWLPDVVQVGGVWTPPALRSRGYARCVVAGSLVDARSEGVERAVLFTDRGNAPAQRAYEALGFRVVGEYGFVIFADPLPLGDPDRDRAALHRDLAVGGEGGAL